MRPSSTVNFSVMPTLRLESLRCWEREFNADPKCKIVHTNGIVCDDSLVAYFVLFYKKGFSPNDLRRAQKADGE